jgi:hypothetical protein
MFAADAQRRPGPYLPRLGRAGRLRPRSPRPRRTGVGVATSGRLGSCGGFPVAMASPGGDLRGGRGGGQPVGGHAATAPVVLVRRSGHGRAGARRGDARPPPPSAVWPRPGGHRWGRVAMVATAGSPWTQRWPRDGCRLPAGHVAAHAVAVTRQGAVDGPGRHAGVGMGLSVEGRGCYRNWSVVSGPSSCVAGGTTGATVRSLRPARNRHARTVDTAASTPRPRRRIRAEPVPGAAGVRGGGPV